MAEMTRDDQLIEYDDYWVVAPLAGKTVTRCFVDHALGIECWDRERETTIRIEGNFVFRVSGAEHRLSPEQPTALGPALSIIHKGVVSAWVHKGGCLEVNFSDGSGLSVEPDAEYEAWEIVGSGGLRVVCAPGGTLSIWQ
ncbi:MAG: hypothetical protein HYZ81_05085 [Nitrospinae bacterium]|nr:hypothetical protein [Nitrospinota bacterium]